jgi:hypothetical protein
MGSIAFRLTANTDPEERLEEAALWKAMRDHYGDRIFAIADGEEVSPDVPMFGRTAKNDYAIREVDGKSVLVSTNRNPVSADLPYWTDPVFLEHCGRSFATASLDEVPTLVAALHAQGKDAFIKSTRMKHYIAVVRRGEVFNEVIGDMGYSFIDGTKLMVQEYCAISHEARFFVIDRRIATWSPNHVGLTPIDFPMSAAALAIRTSGPLEVEVSPSLVARYEALAERVASAMATPHAAVDIGLVNGHPAVIEFNPMQLGQLGLFACDVRALARASEGLLADFSPASSMIVEDEEDFDDDIAP